LISVNVTHEGQIQQKVQTSISVNAICRNIPSFETDTLKKKYIVPPTFISIKEEALRFSYYDITCEFNTTSCSVLTSIIKILSLYL